MLAANLGRFNGFLKRHHYGEANRSRLKSLKITSHMSEPSQSTPTPNYLSQSW